MNNEIKSLTDITISNLCIDNKDNFDFQKNNHQTTILQLTVINSTTLPNGTKIFINSTGLVQGSLRKKNDGITYFGYNENLTERDNENSIDYVLLPKYQAGYSSAMTEKYVGRFFQISYIEKSQGYYLKDLGNGLGTFIKLKDYALLKDNSLISIGDSFLVINLDPSIEKIEAIEETGTIESRYQGVGRKLIVKVFDGKNQTKGLDYIFNYSSKKRITIGRKKYNNDIEMEDPLVSKVNSTIEYKENEGWVIRDGSEIKSGQFQPSRNGTWFLAIEDYKIYEGLIFKGHFDLFCCNFIKK